MANRRSSRAAGLLLLAAAVSGACNGDEAGGGARRDLAEAAPGGIAISPAVPGNLTDTTLAGAATFAWNEFIALNWPAVPQNAQPNTRDVADTTQRFGDPSYQGPLVWHTFRSKIEIFPVAGSTPNGYDTAAVDYGYDAAPNYTYATSYSGASGPAPWINLDENDEIGLDAMYAGVSRGAGYTNGLILFTAKANRKEYAYVAAKQFFVPSIANPAKQAGSAYVTANRRSPPPGGDLPSLPDSTIEIKAAWRALGPADSASRFYQTTVRYYKSDNTYVDTTFGLVALHIIQKTPGQPFFVYATFEQADNILTATGARVEDENGALNPGYDTLPPMEPVITAVNATNPAPNGYLPSNIQQLGPDSSTAVPGSRLFYINSPGPETRGAIAVNRRVHSIPQTIISANQAAHAAMADYAQANSLPAAVWQYYKLVNVQYAPIDKQPGVNYSGADSATYYQANIVVETDHNLQTFSGQFQPQFTYTDSTGALDTVPFGNLITDWCGSNVPNLTGCQSTDTPSVTINGPFHNVFYNGQGYNMGGCMGCHGNAQVAGADFSFILRGGNNSNPETADPVAAPLATEKRRLLDLRNAARASPAAGQ